VVQGVDSEVTEVDVGAFGVDVRSCGRVGLIYCAFPTEFD